MSVSTPQPGSRFASNIPKYFVYIALKGFGFGLFVSIWVIYLQQRRGLSLAQAALIDTTFFVAAAFGEIPTGVVADVFGRKISMIIGAVLLTAGGFAWATVPTMPLIMVAYVAMGLGLTFQSGAEDALFYESLQKLGRADDYTRLAGRAGATFPGALALGSVVGGLLASIDLILPYLASTLVLLTMTAVVLTLREPKSDVKTEAKARKTFGDIFRQSFDLMRERPALRYPVLYLALVPLASWLIESLFLQPQALALGVPLAGVGVLFMLAQVANVGGSAWSDQVKARIGETRLLYTAPVIILGCLILLAALQILPALLLIAVMGFVTSALRPILLTRIQNAVSDDVRATVISMQSLLFTLLGAVSQPTLGFIADRAGLPSAYIMLAGGLGVLVVYLLWTSRRYFPVVSVPG
jgi:MFS family permease